MFMLAEFPREQPQAEDRAKFEWRFASFYKWMQKEHSVSDLGQL